MKYLNHRLASLSRHLEPLWWLVAKVVRLEPSDDNSENPRSILIIDLHLLGDVVMLVPLLRLIRRCHPGARLGLLAGSWAREILAESKLVDEFIELNAPWVSKRRALKAITDVIHAIDHARRFSWDWGIDVRGDVRNILILALAGARRRVAYGFTGGTSLLTDVVPDNGAYRHIIEHHATLANYLGMSMSHEEKYPVLSPPISQKKLMKLETSLIGFHFGGSKPLRRMPIEEACELLNLYLSQERVTLVLLDAHDTKDLNTSIIEQLSEVGSSKIQRWEGNLSELMGLLVQFEKFYAMDSGPAHLAAALGVDVTVFFGPNVPSAVQPWGRRVRVIEHLDMSCRPCDQKCCTNSIHQQCLRDVVRMIGPLKLLDTE